MSANNWAQRNNDNVPARLKCVGDGKWELKDMFSKNMIQRYKSGRDVTCRKHTQGSVEEIKCVNCLKYKPLYSFSKAERKVNGSRRCRDCVEWSEADTPDFEPLPAPNALRSYDERGYYKRPQQVIDVSEDENGEDILVELDSAASSTYQESSVGRTSHSSYDNSYGLTSHARQSFNASNPTYSHVGQSYHASSAPTDTASTFETESTVRPRVHAEFNAYGPEGQIQRQVQSVTAASEMTATSDLSGAPGSKKWAKPVGRKTGIAVPSYLQHENPDEVGEGFDSDGSEDFC